MARRIIAQRILTGELLAWDVPLSEANAVRELSGPGGVFGKIAPVDRMLLGPDGKPLIREWSTALYFEDGGRFHGGGIVTRITETDKGDFTVEAPGFATYPHGIVHARTYVAPEEADALDVYRDLWEYVQSFPDAQLGVTVDSLKSGVKVETVEKVRAFSNDQDVLRIKPYRIPRWEFRDCGGEMDAMLDLAVADYTERHRWNDDRTAIEHHINLGVPRLGKKRRDLRFVEGENVIVAVQLEVDGDNFAQTVYGAGRGEGRKMVTAKVAQRDDRLRRTALFVDKGARQDRLDRLTRREYQRRNDTRSFDRVLIRDHSNARLSDINPGDDVLVEAHLDWYGRVRHWVRVTAIAVNAEDDTAVLEVARSDQFR